jgi:predicted enzyme related to lactoylglutathione lyase
MINKVAFTMYPVTDVARARRFYEETLGLTVGVAGSQGGMHWIEYDLPGGGCLALTNVGEAEPSASGGTVALEVEDLDELVEALHRQDVAFLGDVVRGPMCRMVTCLDSEGNSLLLHQSDRVGEDLPGRTD